METERLAVVTGATGYIGKHIVARLLGAGWAVRATLRDPAREAELRDAVAPVAGEAALARLGVARADLLADAGWDAAMAGAAALVHAASPFPLAMPRDEREVVGPAVEGTRRALGAAARAGVRRVVLTSSIAAVINADLPAGRSRYDERDWTEPTDPRATAYDRSKTLAERAAWEIAQREGLALTAINPGFVIGRPLDRRYGTSLAVVERLLSGRDPMVPDVGFPAVDVGDVAEMHLRAVERPESAGERIIGAERFLGFPEMARILKDAHPGRKIATRRAPRLILRAIALFDPSVRTILPVVGQRRETDPGKAERLLGMRLRDVRDSLRESAGFLLAAG